MVIRIRILTEWSFVFVFLSHPPFVFVFQPYLSLCPLDASKRALGGTGRLQEGPGAPGGFWEPLEDSRDGSCRLQGREAEEHSYSYLHSYFSIRIPIFNPVSIRIRI